MEQNIILLKKAGLAIIQRNSKVTNIIINEKSYQSGDIHIGVIKSILNNINAAFVEIDFFDKNGFIQLEELTKPYLQVNEQPLIFQIVKEPSGQKGPSLSTKIEIKGKYSSLLPLIKEPNLNTKIIENYNVKYLKLLQILFSTNNINISIKEESTKINIKHIAKDIKKLYDQWKIIKIQIKKDKKPRLISQKSDFTYKILQNFYDINTHKIIVDSYSEAVKINNILMQWYKGKKHHNLNIEYYLKQQNIVKKYNIKSILQEVIQSRVQLKSGASIVIEKTEALTVIDVNSGTFKNKITLDKSILLINCEAAKEIAKQLILRNIGGVVVIDFIDMNSQKDQFYLLNYFNTLLNKDKSNPKIIQFSEIGLVELTRTRQRKNTYDIFTTKCKTCNGHGYILKNLYFSEEKNI